MSAQGYYKGGKRVMIDGAPCRVASWVGELGNDKEYQEAVKPRTSFKEAYYAGGYRITRGGVPCRVAANVANWSGWMRAALLRFNMTPKERQETERQIKQLFTNH